MEPRRVVIVGGGFGGIKAALKLAEDERFEVTLVSDQMYFIYRPALYRSATGRSYQEAKIDLHEIFDRYPRVRLLHDAASSLDEKNKLLTLASGLELRYDELILALGMVTDYFGIAGLDKYSFDIKSAEGAARFKDHLHQELRSHKPDPNYVIVGAGPTGVELAGGLATYLRHIYQKHHTRKRFKVMLVEAAPRILPHSPKAVSKKIEKRLRGLGVTVYTGTAVKGETADALRLPEGSVDTHTVVWTAGVTNHPFFGNNPVFKLGKGRRVEVDKHLQAAPHIYVLGDNADTPFTGWAQTAVYDAEFVVHNLKRHLKGKKDLGYRPRQPIAVVPVGQRWSAVTWGSLNFFGYVGWVLRRVADLKLYLEFLAPWDALRTWFYGNVEEETCPECRQRFLIGTR